MGKFGIDTKAKKIALVINPPKGANGFTPDFFPSLNSWLLENSDVYAYILHDLDIKEDGEAKTPHVHVYAEMRECKRMLTQLNSLAGWLNFDTNQISIEKATSPTSVIQYLIHKNDPEKHQYEASEIITSMTPEELKSVLEQTNACCSLSFFKSCVTRCNGNKWLLVELVGLDVYKEYRIVILDLFNSLYKHM